MGLVHWPPSGVSACLHPVSVTYANLPSGERTTPLGCIQNSTSHVMHRILQLSQAKKSKSPNYLCTGSLHISTLQ